MPERPGPERDPRDPLDAGHVADPDLSAEAPPTGRRRLAEAIFRPSRSQAVVAVLLAVVGFAGIVQVRVNDTDDSYAGYREQDLIDLLSGIAGTTQRAEAEIARLQQTRDELRSTNDARSAALEAARREEQVLAVLAGTVPVAGPGLRVTVTEDDDEPIEPSAVLDMVQELRTAGAEAIEVNDQVRLVASSHFGTHRDGITIDGVELTSPYVVEVIGEPDTLAGGMSFPGGPTETFESDDAEVEVEQLETLEIMAVRSTETPQFAEPQD
ncbi:DUF881 domain-containing protein [Nocardioides alkalitolerans]|uniref:DUF881 domain-containing protein n=1 Tax=Nocardioides alkalitolerans TaxID=281714 RepID=UPI00041644FB|nr:DUF881 domain-containing protein [Nocardioides alkalitolerans]